MVAARVALLAGAFIIALGAAACGDVADPQHEEADSTEVVDIGVPPKAGLTRVTLPGCIAGWETVRAFRNTNGPWVKVPLHPAPFRFDATPRFELVIGGTLIRMTTADFAELACQRVYSDAIPAFFVSVQNIPSGFYAGVNAGDFTAGYMTYTLRPNVAPFDLVAYTDGPLAASVTSGVIVRRGLSPVPGTTLPPLDFAGSEPVAPAGMSVTMDEGSAGETRTVQTRIRTARGTTSYLPGAPVSGATFDLMRLAPSQSAPDDIYIISAVYSVGTKISRMIEGYFSPDEPKALVLTPQPPPIAPAKVDLGDGTVSYSASAPVDSAYQGFVMATYHAEVCSSRCPYQELQVQVTGRYRTAAGATSWDLSFPDLRAVGVPMLNGAYPGKSWSLRSSSGALFVDYWTGGWTAKPAGTVVRTSYQSGPMP